jgi:hypothetical protein
MSEAGSSSHGGAVAILAICLVCLDLVVWMATSSWGPQDLYLAEYDAPAIPYTSH